MNGYIGPATALEPRGKLAAKRPTNAIVLRPFVTMVDWMTVMFTGPWHSLAIGVDEAIPWNVQNVRPNLVVYRAAIETRHFARVYYITEPSGEKLATVLCCPVDRKKFPPDFMTVQFSNATLAPGEWRELLNGFLSMGCTYQGVQRVDIAADGWENERIGDGGDFLAVVKAAAYGFGEYYGKAHWSIHYTGKDMNGFQFGSRAGNKFLRCYRKKREMKAKGLKPHIVAAWREALNGYDPMKDPREVGRLEIVLKGKELRRYFPDERTPEGLATLHDPRRRVEVFASTVKTMYDFRTHSTDGRARTARPLHVWDWSLCTTNAPELLPREQRRPVIAPHVVKSGIHHLYRLYLLTSDLDVLLVAERQARSAGPEFLDWMRRKEKVWQAEHRALMNANLHIPGLQTPDPFTRSYLDRLAQSTLDHRTNTEAFNDNAEPCPIDDDDDDDIPW